MRPLVACVALLSLGFAAGRAMRPAPPPLVLERSSPASPALAAQLPAGREINAGNAGKTANAANAYGADGTETERPTDPAEILYGVSLNTSHNVSKEALKAI